MATKVSTKYIVSIVFLLLSPLCNIVINSKCHSFAEYSCSTYNSINPKYAENTQGHTVHSVKILRVELRLNLTVTNIYSAPSTRKKSESAVAHWNNRANMAILLL